MHPAVKEELGRERGGGRENSTTVKTVQVGLLLFAFTRTVPSEHRSANKRCAFRAAAEKLHKQVGIIKLQPKSKKIH